MVIELEAADSDHSGMTWIHSKTSIRIKTESSAKGQRLKKDVVLKL